MEVDEDHAEGIQLQQTGRVSVSVSRDSLEDNGKKCLRYIFLFFHTTRFLTDL